MAVSSSLGANATPENATPRDFGAETERALKARIEEYKEHGRDTEYMEERLRKIQNAKKGRRKSGEEDRVDRADADNCVVDEQEKERLAREADKVNPKGEGVPEQESEKAPNPEAVAGPTPDVPPQTSPWPTKAPEEAVHQPPLPPEGKGSEQGSSQDDNARKAAPTKAPAKAAHKTEAKPGSKGTSK